MTKFDLSQRTVVCSLSTLLKRILRSLFGGLGISQSPSPLGHCQSRPIQSLWSWSQVRSNLRRLRFPLSQPNLSVTHTQQSTMTYFTVGRSALAPLCLES